MFYHVYFDFYISGKLQMALPSCGDIDVDCSGNESSDSQTRTCKICYGTDDEFKDAWASPCKCNGSIKVGFDVFVTY